MKKIVASILAILLMTCCFAGCTPADKSGELNLVESGKLIMSTNAEFPPYEMTDDNGGFVGIDIEIAQAIAKELGLELVIDDMDFDAAMLAVQNGRSDICMAGLTVDNERLKVMDFSFVTVSVLPGHKALLQPPDTSLTRALGNAEVGNSSQPCPCPNHPSCRPPTLRCLPLAGFGQQ